MRVVGLDLGSRRIGVAVSDPRGVLATPHAVVDRSGARRDDHRAIADLIVEVGADRLVVGLPRSLDGSLGPAASDVLGEVEELAAVVSVPVETYDERFTTVEAERRLREADAKAEDRRRTIDKAAAAVMLQSWLDAQTASPEEPTHGDERR